MAAYSCTLVAQTFVKQYYDMLARNTSELYRFYHEESSFCHAQDPSNPTNTVKGLDSIRKRIEDLNLVNAHVDLCEGAVDVQESFSSTNAILVVVTGHFSCRDASPCPFTHTFVLAKPEKSVKEGSYYVHNSMFRLQAQATAVAIDTKSAAAPVSVSVPLPVATSKKVEGNKSAVEVEEEVTPPSVPAKEEVKEEATVVVVEKVEKVEKEKRAEKEEKTSTKEKVASPESQPVKEKANETVDTAAVAPAATVTPAAAAAAAPAAAVTEEQSQKSSKPAKPLSFADMAKKANSSGETRVMPSVARNAKSKRHIAASADGTSSGKNEDGNSSIKKGKDSSSGNKHHHNKAGGGADGATDEGPIDPRSALNVHNSMYIKQVTNKVTEAALRELFSKYGPIKRCDVQGDSGFAFIDFRNRGSLDEALSQPAGSLLCCGATLRLEERTPKAKDLELLAAKGYSTAGHGGRHGGHYKHGGNNQGQGKKKENSSGDRSGGDKKNNAKKNTKQTGDIA